MSEEDRLRAERIRKREALVEMGIDPYGGRFTDVTATAAVRAQAEPLGLGPGDKSELRARVAGRIALLRVMESWPSSQLGMGPAISSSA